MTESFDCIIIGSGPGGYVAAIRAAQLGMSTVVVERADSVGGRCLHEACIPAKTVLRSADILEELRRASEFGVVVGDPVVDFEAIGSRRKSVISGLAGGVAGLLRKNKIEVVQAEGTLLPDGSVSAAGRVLISERATVLATGSVPRPLAAIPFGGRIISTKEAWALDDLPLDRGGGCGRLRGGNRIRLRTFWD